MCNFFRIKVKYIFYKKTFQIRKKNLLLVLMERTCKCVSGRRKPFQKEELRKKKEWWAEKEVSHQVNSCSLCNYESPGCWDSERDFQSTYSERCINNFQGWKWQGDAKGHSMGKNKNKTDRAKSAWARDRSGPEFPHWISENKGIMWCEKTLMEHLENPNKCIPGAEDDLACR